MKHTTSTTMMRTGIVHRLAGWAVHRAVDTALAHKVVERATPEVVAARLAVCGEYGKQGACEALTEQRTCAKKLGGCRCFVDQKARLLGSRCPLNKWDIGISKRTSLTDGLAPV